MVEGERFSRVSTSAVGRVVRAERITARSNIGELPLSELRDEVVLRPELVSESEPESNAKPESESKSESEPEPKPKA